MHSELVSYWLDALGGGGRFELATIPPSHMAASIAAGEIHAFCVGEPWGSVAVEAGAAELVLPGAAIWQFAPEKVLAMSRHRVEADPDRAAALMRAVWRAARWCADPANTITAAEIVGRPSHLDVLPEILERSLASRLIINTGGACRVASGSSTATRLSRGAAKGSGSPTPSRGAPAPTVVACALRRAPPSALTFIARCWAQSALICRAPRKSSKGR